MQRTESKPTVLVVDDEDAVRDFVRVTLDLAGFETEVASSGRQALEMSFQHPPDLIVLDVMMTDMSGYEVAEELRRNSSTAGTTIIMVTAKSMTADVIEGLRAGADDYVKKPFDPEELITRAHAALTRTRSMRDRNPLTALPGNAAILTELTSATSSGENFSLLYIDIDNFKAFNDHYGFLRGDQALLMTAGIISDHAKPFFVGHIGGDDFAVIASESEGEALAEKIIDKFDSQAWRLYDPADLASGYITVADRRGEERKFPVMTLSVGIATTRWRHFEAAAEVIEIASEMKVLAKRQPKSSWALDRRNNESNPMPVADGATSPLPRRHS